MADQPDKELQAINEIVNALTPLDATEKMRVFEYIIKRFDLKLTMSAHRHSTEDSSGSSTLVATDTTTDHQSAAGKVSPVDIRSLKAQKNPTSDIQMTALVAYYLSELAPETEHRDSIGPEDISKYFKQAGYPLPSGKPAYTLSNAKNAGYFDSVEHGKYKLNPVGFNLVAHNLPASTSANGKKKSSRRVNNKKKAGKTQK